MYKWVFLVFIAGAIGLYFSGALEFDTSGDSIDISVDKEKAKEFGESIKKGVEE